MIKDVLDLLYIKHNRLIEDPFPEHTEYESLRSTSMIHKICGAFKSKVLENISIHKAYRMGYDKAYKEIEEALKQ